MTDLRVRPGVKTPSATTGDGIGYLPLRATRDGAISVIDWKTMLCMEGCGFCANIGVEDAPVAITGAVDDELAFACIDVPLGLTIIPTCIQCQIATWGASATLFNFMVEVDKNSVRNDGGGGTVHYPLNLNAGSPKKSGTICYICAADVVPAARTALMSLEVYRDSIETVWGSTGDNVPEFLYQPDAAPVIVGPGALIVHLGSTPGNGDPTAYGTIQWLEFPSHQAS